MLQPSNRNSTALGAKRLYAFQTGFGAARHRLKEAVFVWFEGWAVQGACANHGVLHSLHRQNPSRNGATRRFYGVGNFGDSPPQGRAGSEYVRACYI